MKRYLLDNSRILFVIAFVFCSAVIVYAQSSRPHFQFEAEDSNLSGDTRIIGGDGMSGLQAISFGPLPTTGTNSGARNVVLNHGTFVHGADSGGVGRFAQMEQFLGRPLKFVDLNLGGGNWATVKSSSWGDYEMTTPYPNWSVRQDITITTNLSLNPGPLNMTPAQIRPGLQATARGDNDQHYEVIANRMLAAGHGTPGHPIYIRLGHEPDGFWYPWNFLGGNHDVYKAAYRRVVQFFRAKSSGFKFVYETAVSKTPNPYAPGQTLAESGYPGDDVVDIIGTNVYANNSLSYWNSTGKASFIYAQQWAASKGKPFGIGEWGIWYSHTGDADWFIRELYNIMITFPSSGPGALLYNNYFWQFPEHQLDLGPTPRSLAEYRRLFGTIPAGGGGGGVVQAPDLVVTNISWSPASPAPGQAVTFSATIRNQGTTATPNVNHGLIFRANGQLVTWADQPQTSLAPGASRTVIANGGPSGSSTWAAAVGTHTIQAMVDDINRIPGEIDESNNTKAKSMTVN